MKLYQTDSHKENAVRFQQKKNTSQVAIYNSPKMVLLTCKGRACTRDMAIVCRGVVGEREGVCVCAAYQYRREIYTERPCGIVLYGGQCLRN